MYEGGKVSEEAYGVRGERTGGGVECGRVNNTGHAREVDAGGAARRAAEEKRARMLSTSVEGEPCVVAEEAALQGRGLRDAPMVEGPEHPGDGPLPVKGRFGPVKTGVEVSKKPVTGMGS